MIQFMPANHSNTNGVITILIHSIKRIFKTFLLHCYVPLLNMWCDSWFYGINTLIFAFITNENGHNTHNELEYIIKIGSFAIQRPSIRNKFPLTYKVKYLKFVWGYSNQTWNVGFLMVAHTLKYWHHMPLGSSGVGSGQNIGLADFTRFDT